MVPVIKNPPANSGDIRDSGSIPGSGRCPGEGNGKHPTPVFLPGESHGQRSLAGYSPQGRKEPDMIDHTGAHIELGLGTRRPGLLAWRTPGMGEPGRSMGSHRVRHD